MDIVIICGSRWSTNCTHVSSMQSRVAGIVSLRSIASGQDMSMRFHVLAESRNATDKGGKNLTFVLNCKGFGLEILKFREINGVLAITAVPSMPDYLKGVINLKEKLFP